MTDPGLTSSGAGSAESLARRATDLAATVTALRNAVNSLENRTVSAELAISETGVVASGAASTASRSWRISKWTVIVVMIDLLLTVSVISLALWNHEAIRRGEQERMVVDTRTQVVCGLYDVLLSSPQSPQNVVTLRSQRLALCGKSG